MKQSAFITLLAFLLTAPAAAQEKIAPVGPQSDGPSTQPVPRHVTMQLFNQPSGQRALRQFQRAKKAGRLPAAQAATPPPDFEVGDTRTFQVRNIDESTQSTLVYDAVDFTLKRIEERFYLWVANDQLGDVRERDIDSLNTALAKRTPVGSIDPQEGVINNDETIFGTPPNVDDDGRSDVLLTDIKDGYEPPENRGFVAGFVDPNDLSDNGRGNHRDVLYLDTFPSVYVENEGQVEYRGVTSTSATAAHEYQHLIHANYDPNEATFVNEGLSEFAEVANGYVPRPPTYLANPTSTPSAEGYDQRLLNWNNSLADYQRASLFTNYLAKRIGLMATGRIARQSKSGVAGYEAVLSEEGASLRQIVFDFHTANFLNDPSVDSTLGYQNADLQGVHAEPTRVVDGRTATSTPDTTVSVKPGAVRYVAWDRVEDFSLTLDGSSRVRARALLYKEGQSVAVRELTLGGAARELGSGNYDRVAVVLAHVQPRSSSAAEVTYGASWANEKTYTVTTRKYDDGTISQNGGFVTLQGNPEMLTRFDNPNPEGASLGSVQLPLYFINQFSNSELPEDAPRDFTFVVRAVGSNGLPGRELFTLTRDDPRPFSLIRNRSTEFLKLDLSDYTGTDLPGSIFVGYRNAGGDDNSIVLANSSYDEENRTYLGKEGSWTRLWDINLQSGPSLENRVLPVRAQFLTPRGAVPSVELEGGSLQASLGGDGGGANVDDGSVVLAWKTTQESNLERFIVERKPGCSGGAAPGAFQPIDTVDASGAPTSYSVTDDLFSCNRSARRVRYRLRYVSENGVSGQSEAEATVTPARLAVSGNKPNPFTGSTAISYTLPEERDVRVTVYDALGRRVRTLVDGEKQAPGLRTVRFAPDGLGAGVYFYVLEAGGDRRTGEMVHVK